jgi:myxalamid-type polyketide synthase MxaB
LIEGTLENKKYVFTVSANDERELKILVEKWEKRILNSNHTLAELSSMSNEECSNLYFRIALVIGEKNELIEELRKFLKIENTEKKFFRKKFENNKIAFLFSGQGSQYTYMGYEFYERWDVFRNAILECENMLKDYIDKPLTEILYPDKKNCKNKMPKKSFEPTIFRKNVNSIKNIFSTIDNINYVQLAIFSLEYALVELWKSWGIESNIVMGHSLGEYSAAYNAGIFSLEDSLRLIAIRSNLMKTLEQKGSMVTVYASEEKVYSIIKKP